MSGKPTTKIIRLGGFTRTRSTPALSRAISAIRGVLRALEHGKIDEPEAWTYFLDCADEHRHKVTLDERPSRRLSPQGDAEAAPA